MRSLLAALAAVLTLATMALAQDAPGPLQTILQTYREPIQKSSRTTVGPAIAALAGSGLPGAETVLQAWSDRSLWVRKTDGFFAIAETSGNDLALTDVDSGQPIGTAPKADFDQLRPNSGIKSVIASAMVQFQLSSPDRATREKALASIARDPSTDQLAPLRASIAGEADPVLKAQKERLERLLTLRFDPDEAARVSAIKSFSGDIGVDLRAALNPIVATTRAAGPAVPQGANVAQMLTPGSSALSEDEAKALLVSAGILPPVITPAERAKALVANIVDGQVGGVAVADLDSEANRSAAYEALEVAGAVPPAASDADVAAAMSSAVFYETYAEPSPAVTDAALVTLRSVELRLALNQFIDLALDALSLASIYFLAAIGLAITFGVMRVINMAHGEFIMMGAYTGYVVQQYIADYTISILVALPAAFVVGALAGIAMERLVIRRLYHRPLETLLATFGVSIALQQLAKNIFGTQARPLTSPDWLGGALTFNDIVSISYIRIAIFVLALIFLGVFLFIMKRTRLGLEVRAVTQNPKMAASMGINPERINMMTFALGSGIAGIAGVAIGLFAKVTSELGQDYIVQSFMTVVVGGVGNIWGTLLGAMLIGFLQKGIEWLNPSNTLAAQTYMIIFIIIFIQFRPRGIIALKGRAAGD
ncbi:urea ABC transporter permease subunit UrtB [Tabrizicola sp. J26]|uniref:urea ABC transporter permease subunit UrtB n=1 Tax=Alitabrizicola rongguiensis TaxID=2909234 RepID=UPI001F275E65|nr:urea ABC transporter permease subunit UrtB [Tabrizicola rongguiensis]MCF1709229.1 urea ABC transporter permease subunit UrtB [Tabrizicola rongguiensis]